MCNFNILKVLFVCVADLRELLSAFSKRNDQDTLFEHGVMADAADTTLLSYRKKKLVVKNLNSKHNSREREMDKIFESYFMVSLWRLQLHTSLKK